MNELSKTDNKFWFYYQVVLNYHYNVANYIDSNNFIVFYRRIEMPLSY